MVDQWRQERSVARLRLGPMVLCLFGSVRATPSTLLVNAAGGAAIFGAGDVVAQRIEQLNQRPAFSTMGERLRHTFELPVSIPRMGQALTVGSIWGGYAIPAVYNTAEVLFPGRAGANILLKACFSCGCLSTVGNYAALVLRRTLAGGINLPSVKRAVSTANSDIGGVVRTDLKIWPLYDILCFGIVPAGVRPACTAVVSVLWHTYMSAIAHQHM
eukprot:scaffold207285_cov33-Tisochrysis_lutea.AAC.1